MSKSTKTIKLMIMSVCAAFALSCQAAEMYKETVSGITWTFTVENGCASVGGDSSSYTAVPTSTSGNIAVPSSLGGCPVTRIGKYAFYNCHDIITMTIPDSVKSIGYRAFYGCGASLFDTTSITGVKLVDGWAVDHTETFVLVLDLNGVRGIADYAFNDCSGVAHVLIGDGAVSIGEYAFYDCSSMANVIIPDSVVSIGACAFYNCTGLTSIVIPSSVISIGSGAFSGCSGIRNLTVPQCACTNSLSAMFPSAYRAITNVVISCDVTNIGDNLLRDCSCLTSVTIPDSVSSIGSYAFSGCSGLTSVTIPDSVSSIGSYAFSGCSGLTSVTIPNDVMNIGDGVFCDCSGLTGITIPEGVKSIGDWAFLRCTNLTFARIPASVTNVGYCAFSVCDKLKDVTIPCCVLARQSYFANGYSYLSTTDIFCSYSVITNVIICDGALCIGDGDFQGWRNLRGVAIPDSVRDIGNYAFEGCSSLCNLQLPNVITNIGRMAFKDCQALTDLVLPENLTCVKSEAFRNCSGVTNVALNVGLEDIGESAFYGCSSLTRLEIPDSVTNIAGYAFGYCRGVTNVILGKNLGKVGSHAFYPIAAEIVFRGNAPQIHTSGGLAFDTSCVAHVLYGSTGWGVEIPGIWNGMRIEYMDDDVEIPVITPSDGTMFRNASCTVTIMCETPGASIYYTTDGGTPRPTFRYLYSGPFVIEDTAEICAVAVKDGKYSDYVTATITKGEVLTLPEALGAPAMAVTTGGDAKWRPVDDVVAIHGLSAMSGGIAPEEETWIEFEVFGAGTISFNWRSDCEKDPRNRYSYDRGIFSIDGTAICKIDGLTDWMAVTNVISSGGVHVIRWTYIKDDYDEDDYTGEDCIWVNDVSWAPIELIPELLVDAAASTITNAIESVGFADTDGVKAAIGGSAAKYAAFKEWAQSVKVPVGSDGGGAIATQAGEAAVVANTNAAVAFLLGAERLFENAPTIELGDVVVEASTTLQESGGQGAGRSAEVAVSVTVKDGEDAVQCAADKVKDMFEATTDLGNWNGATKLEPMVTVVDGGDSVASPMRFTVVPGDGTATRAFLRVKVK